MTLDELLALLPDNTTGDIDAEDLRTVVTGLWDRASRAAQVFSYLWVTTPGPGAGKITGPWTLGPGVLQVSETTDDGQILGFAILDNLAGSQVLVVGPGGVGVMHADVVGASVDQGGYRDLPVMVTEVSGAVPALNAKVTLAVLVLLPSVSAP